MAAGKFEVEPGVLLSYRVLAADKRATPIILIQGLYTIALLRLNLLI